MQQMKTLFMREEIGTFIEENNLNITDLFSQIEDRKRDSLVKMN